MQMKTPLLFDVQVDFQFSWFYFVQRNYIILVAIAFLVIHHFYLFIYLLNSFTHLTLTLESNFCIHIPIQHHHYHYQRYRYRLFLNVDSIGLFIKQNKITKKVLRMQTHPTKFIKCKCIHFERARQNIALYARQPMTQQTIQFHFEHTSTYILYYTILHGVYACMHV